MKLFISWSGTRSKFIAEALRWWIPSVIQAVKPFISSRDIQKGVRGNNVIMGQLEACNVGIVCLTPENQTAPWIQFESGALSKMHDAFIFTYLLELEHTDVQPPLAQFQHTKHDPVEMKALLDTINAQLPAEARLSDGQLTETFETWWPKLEAKFKDMPEKDQTEKAPERRDDKSMIREILELVRSQNKPDPRKTGMNRAALQRATERGIVLETVMKHIEKDAKVPRDLIHFPTAKQLFQALRDIAMGEVLIPLNILNFLKDAKLVEDDPQNNAYRLTSSGHAILSGLAPHIVQ